MSPSIRRPDGVLDDATAPALRRAISGRLLFLFILGDVLGAGVYVLIGDIAGEVGGAVWLPLLVALVLALLTAASYAELVTTYPRAAGAAAFAGQAYRHQTVAFIVGACMLAAGLTSAAGLAVAFSGQYLQQLSDVPQAPVALGLLLVIALVNVRGIAESLRANVIMTVVEVSGLLLVVALGAVVLGRGDGRPEQLVQFDHGGSPLPAVLAAALLAFYSYVGFETSANVAEEVRDVRGTYPRALFGSLLTAGLVYVLVGAAVAVAVPADLLARSGSDGETTPLLRVVQAADVGIPAEVFSVIALVAVGNGALLTMIMTSRLTYGMSREQLLPAVLHQVLPGRRTPAVAIVATTAVAMVLAATGTVASLARTVVLLLLVVFISTNLAVLVLRYTRRHTPDRHAAAQEQPLGHFRAPTILPVLALASCVALLTQQDAGSWARAASLIGVITVIYLVTRAVGRRPS
ncbi:MAG: APC family permease [Angustibacter sp.]